MMKIIRHLYNKTMSIARHRHAVLGLAGISFIESSVFPIPPDVVLMPLCLAKREKAFYYATVCMVSSVLGGLFGYLIGYFLLETIGHAILNFYGLTKQFEAFKGQYNEWGAWIVVGAGFTPLPYKIVTIASGAAKMNLLVFTICSIIGRSMRFYLVAGLLWKFGAPIQIFIEKYLGLLSFLFFVLLIGGFFAIKYLV
jgi:membrane protein YqaA with SNARE-associated domain